MHRNNNNIDGLIEIKNRWMDGWIIYIYMVVGWVGWVYRDNKLMVAWIDIYKRWVDGYKKNRWMVGWMVIEKTWVVAWI